MARKQNSFTRESEKKQNAMFSVDHKGLSFTCKLQSVSNSDHNQGLKNRRFSLPNGVICYTAKAHSSHPFSYGAWSQNITHLDVEGSNFTPLDKPNCRTGKVFPSPALQKQAVVYILPIGSPLSPQRPQYTTLRTNTKMLHGILGCLHMQVYLTTDRDSQYTDCTSLANRSLI